MRKILLTVITILGFNISGWTQSPVQHNKMLPYQDSLIAMSYDAINNPNEAERYNSSYKMIKTLVRALKTPGSFNFGFDSLKTVSILQSPDKRFRIFTWHVMNNDGSYRYYGTIQMNSPGGNGLKMFPLVDHSSTIKNPQDTLMTNENWYGAQYYKIIPVTNVRNPHYILLGWKGNTVKTTKKVIEILSFKDNKAIFGMPVFEGTKDLFGKKRIVFEYSRQVSMMLNYRPKENTIVFDHLASPDPKLNKPELMGPDMSYDGFKLTNGRLKYVQDLELKNLPSALDDLFTDPTKPLKEKVNKLR